MKIISYIALTAWISISLTAYFSISMMNKIRIEDEASNAAKNIDILLPILKSLEDSNIVESKKELRYFLEWQKNVAGRCNEYGACNRLTPPEIKEVIERGENYLSPKLVP
jgi:hypothetical protein